MKALGRINRITFEQREDGGSWILWLNGKQELTIDYAGRGGQPRRRREVGWGARRRADNNHDGLSSEKRRACSPLAPVLGGEGSGVRGTWCLQQLHALARDANPLTPRPSPPSTRERGKSATLLDKSTSRKWPSYQRFSSAQVGGEGRTLPGQDPSPPTPLPGVPGRGRILAAGCFEPVRCRSRKPTTRS